VESLGVAYRPWKAVLNQERPNAMILLHGEVGLQLIVEYTLDFGADDGNELAIVLGHEFILVVFEVLKFSIQHRTNDTGRIYGRQEGLAKLSH
jgi:hypothetical protein